MAHSSIPQHQHYFLGTNHTSMQVCNGIGMTEHDVCGRRRCHHAGVKNMDLFLFSLVCSVNVTCYLKTTRVCKHPRACGPVICKHLPCVCKQKFNISVTGLCRLQVYANSGTLVKSCVCKHLPVVCKQPDHQVGVCKQPDSHRQWFANNRLVSLAVVCKQPVGHRQWFAVSN